MGAFGIYIILADLPGLWLIESNSSSVNSEKGANSSSIGAKGTGS